MTTQKNELTWLKAELVVEAGDGWIVESGRQTGPPVANDEHSDVVVGAADLEFLLGRCLANTGVFKSRTTSHWVAFRLSAMMDRPWNSLPLRFSTRPCTVSTRSTSTWGRAQAVIVAARGGEEKGGGVKKGKLDVPYAASKFSFSRTRTQPQVLFGKISTWSTAENCLT